MSKVQINLGGIDVKGSNMLLIQDMENYQGESITWYNEEYLEYVSGAFRTAGSTNGDITFKVKRPIKVRFVKNSYSAYGANGSLAVYINGTSIADFNTNLSDFTYQLHENDTLRYVNTAYYRDMLMLSTI